MSNLSITQYLNQDAVKQNVTQTLGDKAPQFIASVSALVNNNKALAEVERSSLLAACLTAAALDLPINQSLGFAYIIPYKNNKTNETQAQFQAGWKAFVQLAQRSGQYKTINVSDVRDGEVEGINRLTGEMAFNWIDDSKKRETAKVVGYVAYFELINGFRKTLYMTVEELRSHATRYSQAFKANRPGMNPWRDDFDVMARKTVIKLLISKFGPMTTDMQTIQLADQSDVDTGKYLDNAPVDAEEVAADKEKSRVLTHIINAKSVTQLKEVEHLVDTYQLGDQYTEKLALIGGADETATEAK